MILYAVQSAKTTGAGYIRAQLLKELGCDQKKRKKNRLKSAVKYIWWLARDINGSEMWSWEVCG